MICQTVVLHAQGTFSYKALYLKIELLSKFCAMDASYLLVWMNSEMMESVRTKNVHTPFKSLSQLWALTRTHLLLFEPTFPNKPHVYCFCTRLHSEFSSVSAFIYFSLPSAELPWCCYIERVLFSSFQCFAFPGISSLSFRWFFVFFRSSFLFFIPPPSSGFLFRCLKASTHWSSLLVLIPEDHL